MEFDEPVTPSATLNQRGRKPANCSEHVAESLLMLPGEGGRRQGGSRICCRVFFFLMYFKRDFSHQFQYF